MACRPRRWRRAAGRRGIDQAALDAVLRDHELAGLAPRRARGIAQSMATDFSGCAGEALREMLAPAGLRGTARRSRSSTAAAAPPARPRSQPRHPGAVGPSRAQLRAAQRQHHRAGLHALALRRVEAQAPARPAPHRPSPASGGACGSCTPCAAQPVQPGAQQRRGLHVGGEDPAGAADEGVDAQARRPVAQRLRRRSAAAAPRPARAACRSGRRRRRTPRRASGSARPCRPAGTCGRPRAWRRTDRPARQPRPAPSAAISPAGPPPDHHGRQAHRNSLMRQTCGRL